MFSLVSQLVSFCRNYLRLHFCTYFIREYNLLVVELCIIHNMLLIHLIISIFDQRVESIRDNGVSAA